MSTPVSLQRLHDFRAVLANYGLSEHAHKVLHDTKLLLLVGIAGSGRNTIIRELEKSGEYYFIVSDTTRPAKVRDGKLEQNAVHYFFRSEDEVLADLEAGEFLEASIIHGQQVSGISIRELERASETKKIAVTDIEYVGADNVVKAKPDSMCIFVVPPGFDEWRRRLEKREKMSEEELVNRIVSARKELSFALDQPYYTFVVNDEFHHATKVIHALATAKEYDPTHDEQARQTARQLLAELNV